MNVLEYHFVVKRETEVVHVADGKMNTIFVL